MPKNMKKRKWDDSNFVVIYGHAKKGLNDEEIAEHMEVPFHTFRRWMRSNDALRTMVDAVRGVLEEEERKEKPVDDEGSKDGDGLLTLYHEFSHLNPPMKKTLLMCYAQTGVISHAARAAGTSRENHYRWLNEDPEYAELFEKLYPLTVGRLEDQALTHAMYGMRRYKFNQGGRPIMVHCDANHPEARQQQDADGNVYWARHYYEDEFSPSLQIFMLKCLKPETYRDKPIEVHGSVTVGVDLNQILQQAERNNVIDVAAIESQALTIIQERDGE